MKSGSIRLSPELVAGAYDLLDPSFETAEPISTGRRLCVRVDLPEFPVINPEQGSDGVKFKPPGKS